MTRRNRIDISEVAQSAYDASPIVGLVFAVGGLAYHRGRLDGSSLSAAEFSRLVAETGPYWPLLMFGIGMGMMGTWLALEVWYGRS